MKKAGDEKLTHNLIDFLMGELDGMPKVSFFGGFSFERVSEKYYLPKVTW